MNEHIDVSRDNGYTTTAPYAQPLELNSYLAAHKFMLGALLSVYENLPESAQKAVKLSKDFASRTVDPDVEEEMRMSLWKSISGREMDDTPDVLGVRATICIMFLGSSEPPSPPDVLEFFLEVFNAAKFPQYNS